MRRIVVLTSAVWIAVVATIAVSFLFWRIGCLRPHAIWAVLSIVCIGTSTVGLVAAVLWRVVRGPDRWRAVGWLLLGLTPLVWIGAYFTRLATNGQRRDPVDLIATVYLTITWTSSVMDAQARWRYPRWTHGRHTVLIDNGQTPDAARLVDEMDADVEAMAELLGQPVPDDEIAWVRGSLVGLDGREIELWALCGQEDNPGNLTNLDRHEVAHTLIWALAGPDHAPPCLLMEGWAVSQSGDRDEHIRVLARQRSAGNAYSLTELVGPYWYSRDSGPVYWEGGPLVDYLLVHYGPEKFFDLYKGAHSDTFDDDCRRILGDTWETVDAEFWAWIEAEAAAIATRSADEAYDAVDQRPIQFAADVNAVDWQELVAAYRDAHRSDGESLSTDEAFIIERKRIDTGTNAWPVDERTDLQLRAIFAGDELWMVENATFAGGHFVMVSNDRCANLRRYEPEGPLYGWTAESSARLEARREAADCLRRFRSVEDPRDLFPPGDIPGSAEHDPAMTILVTKVTRPAEGSKEPWRVSFVWQTDDGEVDPTCALEIAPELNWSIIRYVIETPGVLKRDTRWQYRRDGDKFVPWAMTERVEPHHYEVTTELRSQPLSDDEQQQLRQQVEQAALTGPIEQNNRLLTFLNVIIIACPLGGVMLLALTRRNDASTAHERYDQTNTSSRSSL
jgi:hypothetical protein